MERQQVITGSAAFTLRYAYDRADRIVQITYPSGRIVEYTRDTLGRVSAVSTRASAGASSQSLLSNASYEAFGALTSATLGNGQMLEQAWSADGRLTARRLRQGSTTLLHGLTYAYDNDDNPTAITDEVDATRSLSFNYDPADRLSRVTMASGTMRREDYVHDANGNRIRVERRALPTDANPASTDTYTRTSGTNRIASIATASGTRTLSHDARGNLSAEARPGSVNVTTGYDGYGRLTGYTRTGQPSLAMAYNGNDERVALTRGTATTRFIHDPDGRVIGEYTASPTTPIAEYIWLLPETGDASESGGDDGLGGWHPLSVVTANGAGGPATLLWLHSNHLGTPVRASTATGASAPLTGFTLPGFPGQLQTLPDLYYNQHRDYDPTTGRYIQADPIGLAGDANPYLYAGASPMRFVDPEGLRCLILSSAEDEPGRRASHQVACNAVDPDDSPSTLHIFGHGTPDLVCDENLLCRRAPEFFSSYIRNNPRYSRVARVQVWACYTGSTDDGFAQTLANIMQIPVNAPPEFTWFGTNGTGFRGTGGRRPGGVSEALAELFGQRSSWQRTGGRASRNNNWRTFMPQR